MKFKSRIFLVDAILVLAGMLFLYMDELYLKQVAYDDYRFELIKIVLHSFIAYKASKFLIKKFDLQQRLNLDEPFKLFVVMFCVLNSYLLVQYGYRVLNNKIVNKEVRKELARRTVKLEYAGWGYECDSLSFIEYQELLKHSKIIDIPEEASAIFVYDWYEFDYGRIVEFNVPSEFNLGHFYKEDSSILNHIEELKNGDYLIRTRVNSDGYTRTAGALLEIDSSAFRRYKFEVGTI